MEESELLKPQISFEDAVDCILKDLGELLKAKNASYGNAALSPLRVFSKCSSEEQLRVRIDDKLSRIAKGSEYPSEDTITDLLGYLVLYKINQKYHVI
jgi:hypothetical protein